MGTATIDLHPSGANVLVLSAGSTSEDWWVNEIDPNGTLVASSGSQPARTGCENPGHARFVSDPVSGTLFVVLSCRNGALALEESPLQPAP